MLFLNFSGLNYEKYLEYRRIMPIYLTSAHGLCGLTEKMLIHFFTKKLSVLMFFCTLGAE
ncbi:unknown [Bacteroides sp. CAG:598]|nr:unknown [Bacteroides sp. CAG:598]